MRDLRDLREAPAWVDETQVGWLCAGVKSSLLVFFCEAWRPMSKNRGQVLTFYSGSSVDILLHSSRLGSPPSGKFGSSSVCLICTQ